MTEPRRTTLLYDVWVLSGVTETAIGAVLARHGVPARDFALYSLLAVHGPVTPSTIAQLSGQPPATVTDLLRRATARGHVARRVNPEDRRSALIGLTERGTAVHEAAEADFAELVHAVHGRLRTPRDQVREALHDLTAALEASAPLPAEAPARAPSGQGA